MPGDFQGPFTLSELKKRIQKIFSDEGITDEEKKKKLREARARGKKKAVGQFTKSFKKSFVGKD